MKKFVLTLCLLVLTVNVNAERRFVLVELYHLKNADFSQNYNEWIKNISKPHCNAGGTPEIDTGTLQVVSNYYDGTRGVRGRLIDYPQYNYWQIVFPNHRYTCSACSGIELNVKVYCAYPIQCIKQ